MGSIGKKLGIIILFLFMSISACGPRAGILGVAKIFDVTNTVLACGLSAALNGKESLSLVIEFDLFNSQFLATVKSLNIKTVDAFEATAPAQAKEFVTDTINRAFEKLEASAIESMHSKQFYYKFLTRSLLNIADAADPSGDWHFSQAEFIQTEPNAKTVKTINLYISIQKDNLKSSSSSVTHKEVMFCDQ